MKKIFQKKTVQLLVLAIVAVLLSVLLNIVMDKAYSDWVPADAVITGWRSATGIRHILYFEYSADGALHSGQDSFRGNFPKVNTGDIVTVWYDPDNVTRVMIEDTKPDAGLWTYAPFFFAVPTAVFIIRRK